MGTKCSALRKRPAQAPPPKKIKKLKIIQTASERKMAEEEKIVEEALRRQLEQNKNNLPKSVNIVTPSKVVELKAKKENQEQSPKKDK